MQNKVKFYSVYILLIYSIILIAGKLNAQEINQSKTERDTLLTAARNYMNSLRFCALITTDSIGSPHVRTMDPFKPDDSMIVWLGTNKYSRKVKEIHNNPKVALYYTGNKGIGYVSITGHASIVNDSVMEAVYWKNEWKNFYSANRENYVLIKVIPIRLEILNYKSGIVGDKKTWDPPFVKFKNGKTND